MSKTENLIERTLIQMGFEALNEQQTRMFEASKTKKQILLLAPTGSGKTLSFLLPLVSRLHGHKRGVQALILVPVRELALQIEQVFKSMATGYKISCCYGGHPFKTERNNLTEAPSVIVGTPGRIVAHLKHRTFDTQNIESLIIDEYDKSLEMGFSAEMEEIVGSLEHLIYSTFTSATSGIEVPHYLRKDHLFELNFLTDEPSQQLAHKAIRSKENDKLQVLVDLITLLHEEASLVFCNHREAVERISEHLWAKGISHGMYHGGLEQEVRERELIKFRNGSHHILLATELAARGIDIPQIRNILHYQPAKTVESYTHRNGRTARVDRHGVIWHILSQTETLSDYITETPEWLELPENLPVPTPTPWTTLYIGAGKKEKISKKDIVGFLVHQGELEMTEIGLIFCTDHASFVAVASRKAKETLRKLESSKIKSKKVRIAICD